MDRRRWRALTLVELLVVLALLSLLAAIVYPAFASARRRGYETTCRSNLRQIGQALQMYRQDWELPPWWIHQLHPVYVRSPDLFRCPADPFVNEGGWTYKLSWCLFVQVPQMGLVPPRFPVSYVDDGFMRQPTHRRVLLRDPRGSYTACVLHGEPTWPGSSMYGGKTLRLGFDAAVRTVTVAQDRHRFSFWRTLSDAPRPAVP